ncbi:hypothetical protein DL771_001597 [Monosporascus sp. 5C6A]|nr:hypothetical protein DL771_001597 [Monosporascus sp. 5C6A]
MRPHKALESDDAREAQWEAARGAAVGAVKWGAMTAVLGGVAWVFSPLYRGLTVQFKVWVYYPPILRPMSGMIVGSMIEADHRMRQFEHQIRMQRRIARDRAVWERFEQEYPEVDDPPQPPPPSSGAK